MHRIRNIVVPTDFSPLSEAAALRAATLAELEGATIHLIHVLRFPLVATPYDAAIPATVWEDFRRAAEEQLEAAAKKLEGKTTRTVTTELFDASNVIEAIQGAVEKHKADLVIMGTHGRGRIQLAFLGSVTDRALRSIDRPILAVKQDPAGASAPITRILLAVDFSEASDAAVDITASLAEGLRASVDVIHVFDLPRDYIQYATDFGAELEQKIQAGAVERLAGVRERLRASRVPVTLHARRGSPSLVIPQEAQALDCQLIVMGTRGNSGLSHVLLGSVAERTLRTSHCAVLAVKEPEPKVESSLTSPRTSS